MKIDVSGLQKRLWNGRCVGSLRNPDYSRKLWRLLLSHKLWNWVSFCAPLSIGKFSSKNSQQHTPVWTKVDFNELWSDLYLFENPVHFNVGGDKFGMGMGELKLFHSNENYYEIFMPEKTRKIVRVNKKNSITLLSGFLKQLHSSLYFNIFFILIVYNYKVIKTIKRVEKDSVYFRCCEYLINFFRYRSWSLLSWLQLRHLTEGWVSRPSAPLIRPFTTQQENVPCN